MDTKSWYWAPHPTEGYLPVNLKQTADGFVARDPRTAEEFIVKKEDVMPAAESSLEPCDNLVTLEELTEPALLHNLRIRFSQDIIYTWVSSILISVNPFKQIPIYSTHVMAQYRQGLAQHKQMSPHIFTVADNAYKSLTSGKHANAIIISGESGAGKTECTKQALQYLAEVAGSASVGSSDAAIADRILSTNPILEAFGNAKTVRNNNSSRFGKLIKLVFGSNMQISGATFESYLLEKSRIVQQSEGERNYHIFYQMLSGLSDREKQALSLTHPSDYSITAGSFGDGSPGDKKAAQKLLSSYSVDGIDDKDEFYRTQKAFEQIGINTAAQNDIYRVTAGCLHLGNIEFTAKGDSCEIASNSQQSLKVAASLLGLDLASLSKALVSQLKQMGKDWVTTQKNKPTAEAGLQACIKSIYSQQFDWLVEQMNRNLAPQKASNSFIGILDIFGFEVFVVNSFEQLCINFTNEKMQSHFNQHVFRLELDEYKAEQLQLDVSSVSYVDNQPCLDLIETSRACVLALCDEELRTPKGTDETLLEKMHSQLASNQYYIKPKTKGAIFGIQHYAGKVDYTITGFMSKNKDQLDFDLANALAASSVGYMKELMLPLTDTAKVSSTTLGKKFKTQLGDLMKVLNSSEPHFIRCIKSNNKKISDTFDGDMVLSQMRYLGLREVVLIRQRGFPIRRPFKEFLQRYKLLLPNICPAQAQSLLADPRKATEMILQWSDPSNIDWKMGKSKSFYRMQIQTKLEQARDQALSQVVLELQTQIRCKLERTRFLRRNQVLVMLRQAVTSTDLKFLDDVIDQCERLSISPSGKSEMSDLFRQVTEIRNKLSEQSDAINALKRAMSTKDIEMLLLAILTTRNAFTSQLGIKSAPVNVKLVKVNELKPNELQQWCPEYSQAVQLVQKLKEFETTSEEVAKSRDISQAQYVVQLAKELQLPQGTIQRWENLYMQLKEEKKVQSMISSKNSQQEYETFKKQMQIAIDNQIVVLLVVLLQRAQQSGFHNDPLFEKGRALEAQLSNTISAMTLAKELKFALDSNDLDVIKYAIKVALDKGFGAHDLVRQCKEQLLVLENVHKVKKALQDSLLSPKRIVVEHAISEAEKLGGTILQSEEYLQAQKALAEMKEKQKKFNHRQSVHARRSVVGQAPPSMGKFAGGTAIVEEGDENDDNFVRPPPNVDIWATASIDELQIALAEAESAGLDDAQVRKIKNKLNSLQAQKQALDLLQTAVDSSNLRLIESSIDRCEKAGISLETELLSRALKLRSHLRDKKTARAGGQASHQNSALFGTDGANILSLPDIGTLRELNVDTFIQPLQNIDWYTDSVYEIQSFPYLRSAAEFLKSNQYTENDKIAMFKHQSKELANTMIQFEQFNERHFQYDGNIGADFHVPPNQQQSFVAHATSLFKSIQTYMFDRKLSFPESLIAELILTCQSNPCFRDEVYILVIKQLTDNPHIPSLLQGWRLLAILSRYIAPSPTFFPYVMRYVYSHTPDAQQHHDVELRVRLDPKMTTVEQQTLRNTACYALTMLPMTLKESLLTAGDLARRNLDHFTFYLPPAGAAVVGTTGKPVSSDKATKIGRYDQQKVQELITVITAFASKSMMPVLMHIYFTDYSAVGITVTPWDTPTSIVQRACEVVGLTDVSGLWLYENYKDHDYALLPYENPIDIQRTWLDKSQKKRKLFTTTKQSKFSRFTKFINDSLSSISEPNTIQGRNGLIVNKSGKRKIIIRRRTFFNPIQLSYDKIANCLLFFQTVVDINHGLHHLHQDSAAMLARMTQILLPKLSTIASNRDIAPPPPPDDDGDDDDVPPPPPPMDAMVSNNNVGKTVLMSGEVVEIDETLPLDPPDVNLVKTHTLVCPPNLLSGKNKITEKKFFAAVAQVQLDMNLLSLEQYVATVMQLPTFAACFFHLDQTFDPTLPNKVILAVNQTGIFILDNDTRASLEQYSLMQVLGWSAGPQRLTLHARLTKPDKQGKTARALRFETDRNSVGQEVCQLLMAYAKDMLEKMSAKTQ